VQLKPEPFRDADAADRHALDNVASGYEDAFTDVEGGADVGTAIRVLHLDESRRWSCDLKQLPGVA
jgi:hypothetical protein